MQKETDLELLPLTEEKKTVAEQLRAHMSDLLGRNGLAQRNSNGEEINPRNLGRCLVNIDDYWSGDDRKEVWLGSLDSDAFHRRGEYERRVDIVLIKFSQRGRMERKRF